jgi:glycosyltransferase involved in cell wall biosynthesis
MRIVFIDSGNEWRGGQYQVFGLAQELRAKRHEMLLVCQKRSPLHERAKQAGLPVEAVRMRGDLDFKAWLRVAGILRVFQPELVHAHTGRAHAVALGATFFQEVGAFVVTRRVGTPLRIRFVNRLKYSRLVSAFVAISEHVAGTLTSAGISPGRVHVIPSAVNLEEFEEEPPRPDLRQELDLKEGTPVVLNVGFLSKEKSQKDVVRVARIVKDRVPDVKFIVVGSGPLRHKLEGLAKEYDVDSIVRFLGFRDDVPALMRLSSMFLFPSESEGLGSVVLQAMASGLPVIASESGGTSEIVRHGETGFVFAKHDVASMADAVARLVSEPGLRTEMGKRGRSLAEGYSFERCCTMHEELYRELVG